MQVLIDDLLTYAGVGRPAATADSVDLNVLFNDVVANLELTLQEANAVVECGDLPTVRGNPTSLLQLFQNLLSNAMKFHHQQTPVIRISCTQQGNEWIIAVSDNGIGIASDQQERIFHMFQRLHARNEYEGTGMGLAICRKIVERHGGRIWVDSALGQGATFYIALRSAAAAQHSNIEQGALT